MNSSITLDDFLFFQPNSPIEKSTDKIYLALSNRLLSVWQKADIFRNAPIQLKKITVLGLIQYYQDIISDQGVWRTFITECKRLYGQYLPFYADDDNYIEYELNLSDIKFLIWYYLAFNSKQYHYLYPYDKNIAMLADIFFLELDKCYDDIPNPEEYNLFCEIELHNSEYCEAVYDISNWLYWKNYLMLPAFQATYAQFYYQTEQLKQNSDSDEITKSNIDNLKQDLMSTIPTGPLALYLTEWLHLIVDGKYPKIKNPEKTITSEHKFYTAFRNATNGKIIQFIANYSELNRFFIDGLNWEANKEHLPELKGYSDFVLYVTPEHGLLIAKDIAKCINHPDNKLYDKEYAHNNSFQLLSQRGKCPSDLLHYLSDNNMIVDARFPNTDDFDIVAKNRDFIERVYLQEYYRGDL